MGSGTEHPAAQNSQHSQLFRIPEAYRERQPGMVGRVPRKRRFGRPL